MALGFALITCGGARRIVAQSVPARAPDSISTALWDSLTEPGNLMKDAPHLHGTWVRNVMLVSFKRNATQAERQAVIALINGEVVGGTPWGQYIVRIPYARAGDSISGPVLRAFMTLEDHPSVLVAYPVGMTNFNVLHGSDGMSTSGLKRDVRTPPAPTEDSNTGRPVPVPPLAPDSISRIVWDSLTSPSNIMTDPPGMRGRWARNVMFITFQHTATQADRQAVIDLIHGEVLGDNRWPGGGREYIVRIPYATAPGDSVSGPVLRAFLALHGHPSVLTAYPLSMDNLSKIHYRNPKDGAGIAH